MQDVTAIILSGAIRGLNKTVISSTGVKVSFVLILLGMTSFLSGAAISSARIFWMLPGNPIPLFADLLISLAPILIASGIIIIALDYWVDSKIEMLEIRTISSEIQSENNLIAVKALDRARHTGLEKRGFLRYMDLKKVNLEGGDFSSMDLFRANLDLANLENCSFAYTLMKEISARGANFKSSDLKKVNLERADLRRSNLELSNLFGANFHSCTLVGANLEGVYANSARFSSADLSLVNFENAILASANFSGANLSEANLRNVDLSGANFENANLSGTNFDNIHFDNSTVWPDNFSLSLESRKLPDNANN